MNDILSVAREIISKFGIVTNIPYSYNEIHYLSAEDALSKILQRMLIAETENIALNLSAKLVETQTELDNMKKQELIRIEAYLKEQDIELYKHWTGQCVCYKI